MKERPLLFSAPMVLALLDGRKTQTRRVVKLPRWHHFDGTRPPADVLCSHPNRPTGTRVVSCPYGVPGDRLWVKETFCWRRDPITARLDCGFWYAADGDSPIATDGDGLQRFRKDGTEASPWISSLYMPREASRITLEITDVRVQRLHDISEADARAEGFPDFEIPPPSVDPWQGYGTATFCLGWGRINGAGSWEANPWVWALTFRRLLR